MKTTILLLSALVSLSGMTNKDKSPSTVYIPQVFFEPNSTKLSAHVYIGDYQTDTVLIFDTLATIINEIPPEFEFQITGNTDFLEENELSTKRAEKVKKLLSIHGVNSNRLNILGINHTRPIINEKELEELKPEEQALGRRRNMRVTIEIRNKKSEIIKNALRNHALS